MNKKDTAAFTVFIVQFFKENGKYDFKSCEMLSANYARSPNSALFIINLTRQTFILIMTSSQSFSSDTLKGNRQNEAELKPN